MYKRQENKRVRDEFNDKMKKCMDDFLLATCLLYTSREGQPVFLVHLVVGKLLFNTSSQSGVMLK